MIIRESFVFDDVMLVPQYSDIPSRSDVDISVKWGGSHFAHPIIPANMQTITGQAMATAAIKNGGLAILHRFMPEKEQLQIADKILDDFGNENFAVSVGVKERDKEMVETFWKSGIRMVCIDIAHGDSEHCLNMVKWIKAKRPDMFVIGGNVATGSGAERMWRAGAEAVRCGVGNGSICSTRIKTGNGVPQLTALMDVADRRFHLKHDPEFFGNQTTSGRDGTTPVDSPMYIISDGGVREPGDVVKALCFADMVMTGNIFAGCEETPSKTLVIDNVAYREYVGSSTHKTTHIEGVAALVPIKGSFQSVLKELTEGITSGCSYQGARNLSELKDNPVFVRITNAGLKESHPHDVIIK